MTASLEHTLPTLPGRAPRRAPAVALPLARLMGLAALAAMLAAAVMLGAGAAGQRLYFFVPGAHSGFPDWMRGPLSELELTLSPLGGAMLLVALSGCYLVVLACARRIPARVAVGAIVALHAIFLLAPPLFSADVFGYIDYARLGVVHGLDPYANGAAAAPHDAAAPFVRWHDVASPYGPLFTLCSYAFATLSVPVTLWIYKALAALASLGCVSLIWRITTRAGRDPRPAVLLFGLNPLLLAYGVGGAHNDFALQLLVLGAIASATRPRPAPAGAQVALAALVKLSAGLTLPFLIIGSTDRRRALLGALLAVIAVAVAGMTFLGGHVFEFVPQIFQQQRLVARYSVPSRVGDLLGFGGLTPALRIACAGGFAVTTAGLLWRAWRGADWVACAGWATLAALVTSAWLTPWYVVWLLPLAAVSSSRRLRIATLVFCGYVVATRVGFLLA
ncbi:MAG TPA: glycosyltransferase family 87 protein [Solirubrobacteraceae bacterium]|nr:glycosyltransferase family 87 protein [Solirubrobacteraceae bacterium]